MRRTRTEAHQVLLTVLLAIGGAVSSAGGAEVRFRLVDTSTGKTTPAMACITDVPRGEVRLPPDGRVVDEPGRTQQFFDGIRFDSDRNWVGPVRKMAGRGDNDDRAFVYEMRPSLPYWSEPVTYQVSGDFTIELPEGKWRVAIEHGNEFIPVVREIEITSDDPREETIRLERWIDLPKLGWYSGDVHVHHPILEDAHREFLLQYAIAADVHVVNVLEMGDHKTTAFKQLGFGKEFRVRRGTFCLVAGQEEPRSQFGHIIGLNLTGLARDIDTYDLYDLAFNRIKQQDGALVGFAHFAWNGCALPRGFPWYVTTQDIDFVELLQFGLLNQLDYYDYLNLGFQLTAAAGSDIPWGSTLGEVRTFVQIGETFDIDSWFEHLKKGHTFVSNGPFLEFTVDDQLPGSELKRAKGDTIRIRAKAVGHPGIGVPKHLTIVDNNGVVTEVANKGGGYEIVADVEVTLRQSRWIAAGVVCDNNAVAHTTPVYVAVDGKPTWSRQRGPIVIQNQLVEIDKIRCEFKDKTDADSRAIIERLDRAEAYYNNLRERITSPKRTRAR